MVILVIVSYLVSAIVFYPYGYYRIKFNTF